MVSFKSLTFIRSLTFSRIQQASAKLLTPQRTLLAMTCKRSIPMEHTKAKRIASSQRTTAEVQTAIPVKQDQWKIPVESSNGKRTWRYFTKEQVDKDEVRKKVESIPFEERKKRNNVEATMFQYSFHTRNNKTRYRTKIKHTLQAIARCAWINMRRLFLYDLEMGLQMATK